MQPRAEPETRSLANTLDELRVSGIGCVLGGIVCAGVAAPAARHHDNSFYLLGVVLLAAGGFATQWKSLAPAMARPIEPLPAAVETRAASLVRAFRTTVITVVAFGLAAWRFLGWEFVATALLGFGAAAAAASVWLARWQRTHGARMLRARRPPQSVRPRIRLSSSWPTDGQAYHVAPLEGASPAK